MGVELQLSGLLHARGALPQRVPQRRRHGAVLRRAKRSNRDRTATNLFEFVKFSTFTPLQERVYELGVCAKCHTKTMRFISAGDGMRFFQCTGCKIVAVLSDQVGGSRGTAQE